MRTTGLAALLNVLLMAAVARADPPLPPPRPDDLPAPPAVEVPLPPERPDDLLPPPPAAAEAIAGCLDRLKALSAEAEPLPALADGACGAAQPLRLSGLGQGLALAPPATVTCPAAEALVRWAQEVVKPEAERHLQQPLAKVLNGTSYECRRRRGGGPLSEHAHAAALDVMGFETQGGAAIPVKPRAEDTPEGRFQAAVRAGACRHFTTVLGPGADAAHADHLHLDVKERRGGYRLCQ